AEWWGKSVLLTFALFKSEPPSGGTHISRYRKNGYVLRLIQHPRGRHASKRPRHRPLQRCVDSYAADVQDRCHLPCRIQRQLPETPVTSTVAPDALQEINAFLQALFFLVKTAG
ncbi:hypothetical protein, partial [Pseudomonas sp. IT-P176]|uniref:hypothetical protein n=1 Tax=Pseudomonas sp. IT-P176 TaxID=3026444 RepID=UPI0039E17E3C